MALQGSSRSQADTGVPAWPESERCPAVSYCPAPLSAPCCPADTVPGLREALGLRRYHRAALVLWFAALSGAQGRPSARCAPAADARSHGVGALARARGRLGGSEHSQDHSFPPRCGCDQAAPWPRAARQAQAFPPGTVPPCIKHVSPSQILLLPTCPAVRWE